MIIKILYICGGPFDYGGISSFIINYYRKIDKGRFIIDFAISDYKKGIYDDEIIQNGSKIFELPIKSRKPITYSKRLKRILEANSYDIVHSHLDSGNYYSLKIAKKCNIPVRIAHAHCSQYLGDGSILLKLLNKYYRANIKRVATHFIACSKRAGDWMFGTKLDYIVLKNAIDFTKYRFNNDERKRYRAILGLSQNDFVIGCVGHLSAIKNQEFLLRVLCSLKKNCNLQKNIKLLFVGEGEDKEKLFHLTKNLSLTNNVIFLGQRPDIDKLYNVFDLFAMPSISEGLGMAAIEAQANGLIGIASVGVPNDVKIMSNFSFLPLDITIWDKAIMDNLYCKRLNYLKPLSFSDYDINVASKELEELYFEWFMNK